MAPPPLPELVLAVTPPNQSTQYYTRFMSFDGPQQQMTITQNFGRQGDTALIPLMEEHAGTPALTVPPMSQILLYDNYASTALFAGVVTNPALAPLGPNLNEWDLNCVDYTFYSDHSVVRWPASTIQDPAQIIVALTNGAHCGITAATVADGGYVASGPSLPDFSLGYMDLSDAWRTLATQMGQVTPYGWYVDQDRVLHFYNQDTAISSGVTFTMTPTKAGSLTEGHILLDSQFSYGPDVTSIANRVMVQGATQNIPAALSSVTGEPTGPPTDQWLGDGYSTAWALRYTVSSGSSSAFTTTVSTTPIVGVQAASSQSTVLYVGGALQVVTVVSSGEAPTGAWNIIANSNGGYFLVAAAPPGPGVSIEVWYSYEAPIIAVANDYASQSQYDGPNGGVFTEYISDSSLTSMSMALATAQQDRAEYSQAAETVTFNTSPDFMGWVRAGYTCTMDLPLVYDFQRNAWGVRDTFLITANQVTFGEGGYRTCQLTAVRT